MSRPFDHRFAVRWTSGVLVIFALLGFGFGSWLGRIPALRDHLGASTLEMSWLGLSLALGSLTGLVFSGRTVSWLGPRRTLAIGISGQTLALPAAAALFWVDATAPAIACLVVYGLMFGTSDVAMNVSGAGAERALGKPRMPLLHAAYSLGSVSAMGVSALAETSGIIVPVHLGATYALILVAAVLALPHLPPGNDEASAPERPASVHTGPTRLPAATDLDAAPGGSYSPWLQPRILVIGLIAMSMALAEGTASDWLPLALADGRRFANESAALTLGVFFVSMTLVRIAGSWLLIRFGRVRVLQGGAILVIAGLGLVILVPFAWVSVVGAVFWGVGCALGFPIGISAAADHPATATRDVAAVSAIAYTAFLLGPMGIGFLGEHLGLLHAFWPLVAFAAFVLIAARAAREPRGGVGTAH
ncbi:MFS transporter [Leucobacter chromiiresistens]|uniref:Fucose permease n=1 Tax=Leucobacter chromiiresistens TaxID=1079994 RepID=A0A1H0YC16_9MICO|nr:MFS transporter [Leucobacter chromiiresistens]SDQ12662.1 Fucose permease [Leucobacter chromiiresistens]